jgi:flagellar FliL protein
MADEDAKQEFKEPKSGDTAKNPLLTILLVVNAILMGVIAYFQYDAHVKEANRPSIRDVIKAEMVTAEKEKEEEEATGEAQEEDGILFPLTGFTANLAQGDGPRRFIRLQAVLKFSKNSNEEEFKARKPQIRDTIISILNSKRPDDLQKIEGKTYLKEEIKAAINTYLVDGHVIDVYYVGFQIN